MAEVKRGRGRPAKLTFARKKEIIITYFTFEANGDPAKLRAYNIYSQLADYARENGYWGNDGREIKAKDFSSDDAKAYILELAEHAERERTFGIIPPVYTPLDIDLLVVKRKSDIVRIVQQREVYYREVCRSAGRIMEHVRALQTGLNESGRQLMDFERRCKALETELMHIKKKNNGLEKEVRHLHNIQREDAKAKVLTYMDSVPDRGVPRNDVLKIIQRPIGIASHQMEEDLGGEENTLSIDIDKFFTFGGEDD